MRDAYRDDLAAAQQRVLDLERESDALREQLAELTRLQADDESRENQHRLQLALVREEAQQAHREAADRETDATQLRRILHSVPKAPQPTIDIARTLELSIYFGVLFGAFIGVVVAAETLNTIGAWLYAFAAAVLSLRAWRAWRAAKA